MTGLFPELAGEVLVLWRLRHMPNLQLWGYLREADATLALALRDPARTVSMGVTLPDGALSTLVNSAIALRDEFTTAGWEVIDADLDEPDYWSHQQ